LHRAELWGRDRERKKRPASAKNGNEPLGARVGLISPMIAHRRGLSLFEIETLRQKNTQAASPVERSSDAPSLFSDFLLCRRTGWPVGIAHPAIATSPTAPSSFQDGMLGPVSLQWRGRAGRQPGPCSAARSCMACSPQRARRRTFVPQCTFVGHYRRKSDRQALLFFPPESLCCLTISA
jgi:hypothetical protein